MMDVLSINKNLFGTTFVKGGLSRKAKKAMAIPLELCAGIEMTYEDCENVEGGYQEVERHYNMVDFFIIFAGLEAFAAANAWKVISGKFVSVTATATPSFLGALLSIFKGMTIVYSFFNALDGIINKGYYDVYYGGVTIFGNKIELFKGVLAPSY